MLQVVYGEPVPMPAVTVCNLNNIKRTEVDKGGSDFVSMVDTASRNSRRLNVKRRKRNAPNDRPNDYKQKEAQYSRKPGYRVEEEERLKKNEKAKIYIKPGKEEEEWLRQNFKIDTTSKSSDVSTAWSHFKQEEMSKLFDCEMEDHEWIVSYFGRSHCIHDKTHIKDLEGKHAENSLLLRYKRQGGMQGGIQSGITTPATATPTLRVTPAHTEGSLDSTTKSSVRLTTKDDDDEIDFDGGGDDDSQSVNCSCVTTGNNNMGNDSMGNETDSTTLPTILTTVQTSVSTNATTTIVTPRTTTKFVQNIHR